MRSLTGESPKIESFWPQDSQSAGSAFKRSQVRYPFGNEKAIHLISMIPHSLTLNLALVASVLFSGVTLDCDKGVERIELQKMRRATKPFTVDSLAQCCLMPLHVA
jgi:hypothetical protein